MKRAVKHFEGLPLGVKLTAMVLLVVGAALLVATVLFAVYDRHSTRANLVFRLQGMADLVAGNSTAALAFGDEQAAGDIVRTTATDPRVEVACLYRTNGPPLASYVRPDLAGRVDVPAAAPAAIPPDGSSIGVLRTVRHAGETVGVVYVRYATAELDQRLLRFVGVGSGVALVAGLVAVLLTVVAQRRITGPLRQLSRAVDCVSVGHPQGMRVEGEGKDELGTLVVAFNRMLAQIEDRDAAVRLAHDALEERVEERTKALRAEIAERERAERELQRSKDAAEEASRLKSEFLANMSHEIRTPMNAIVGMTELALDTEPGQEQREYLETVRVSAASLLQVLNDILDLSKIEAGKLDLGREPFRLRGCVEDAVRVLAFRAREKGLQLETEFAPELPEVVAGDPLRIRQVLVNLLGNAVKFTERGHVRLRVDMVPAEETGPWVRFSVEDTGIGIAPDRKQMVFEAFNQADGSFSRRFGGTGLGLSISRRLVEMMGGRIWLESELGRGSTFSFAVPLEPLAASAGPDANPAPRPAAAPAAPLRVLLAEDNPVNRTLVLRLLERRGHRVAIACNGREAVRAVAEEAFDVVLMDIQMPEMDGLEATAEIRRREAGTGGHVPIVALTAHALSGDRERCVAAGMDGYLTKPLRSEELFETLARFAPALVT